MSNLTLFPADIAEMSVSQLAALSPAQKSEIDKNFDAALDWLKNARSKFNAALDLCYGEQARNVLRDNGRDCGTAHVIDGDFDISIEIDKTVKWDQKQLAAIFERIAATGDDPCQYIDVKYSISETKFKSWPETLKTPFEAARTVKPGKASFRFALVNKQGV